VRVRPISRGPPTLLTRLQPPSLSRQVAVTSAFVVTATTPPFFWISSLDARARKWEEGV